jgi:hypothetical protein
LRSRILECSRFTMPAGPAMIPTPPASPEHTTYVDCEDTVVDDFDYCSPPSPAPSHSEQGSDCSSDGGSLTSSGSTIDDLDDDFLQEQQQQQAMPPECSPPTFEPQDQELAVIHQEFVAQHYTGPVPGSAAAPVPISAHVPVQVQLHVQSVSVAAACAPKSYFPFWWDMVRFAQQMPSIQHPVPFQHQLPIFAQLQGCY